MTNLRSVRVNNFELLERFDLILTFDDGQYRTQSFVHEEDSRAVINKLRSLADQIDFKYNQTIVAEEPTNETKSNHRSARSRIRDVEKHIRANKAS